jgi:hypothetical protein
MTAEKSDQTAFQRRPKVRGFRKGIIIASLALLIIVAWQLMQREWGANLPPGKVTPCFAGKLLLAPNGTVWLGDYRDTGSSTEVNFTQFLPGNDWTQLSGSEFQGVAIKEDGSLWWWFTGYPGNKPSSVFHPPSRLGSDLDWTKAQCSFGSALLLKKDGSLWLLGGKMPNGVIPPFSSDLVPLQIGSERDWSEIATGGFVHYALKRDGTLWHWGTLVDQGPQMPVLMNADNDWDRIAANFSTLAALKRDGSLWFGGINGSAVAPKLWVRGKPPPFRAGSDADWVNIAVGDMSLVAKKSNGSWWASGENHYAHLGLSHWFGLSKHLGRPTRIPIKLDVWAWDIGGNTTKLLSRHGNIYYMGKRPNSTVVPAAFEEAVNKASRWIPGAPPLFARPGEDWSEEPVKIGKLPAEVISALKSEE